METSNFIYTRIISIIFKHSVGKYIPLIYVTSKGHTTLVITICIFIVLVAQSYLTLCDPMNCSLPGSSVHEILQA